MNSRLSTLFSLVCKTKKRYPISELAKLCNVSNRTIYNDLKKMNSFLHALEQNEVVIEKGEVFSPKEVSISFDHFLLMDPDLIETNPTYSLATEID
ncbi:HTH domain-containing protein [Amphibacillus sp. Q70]|uniref:HTH domain-containing protein n=1 Tax=Amphibacillus sp. Q70 TaxID=3453416 RepID=UPI003F86B3F6